MCKTRSMNLTAGEGELIRISVERILYKFYNNNNINCLKNSNI